MKHSHISTTLLLSVFTSVSTVPGHYCLQECLPRGEEGRGASQDKTIMTKFVDKDATNIGFQFALFCQNCWKNIAMKKVSHKIFEFWRGKCLFINQTRLASSGQFPFQHPKKPHSRCLTASPDAFAINFKKSLTNVWKSVIVAFSLTKLPKWCDL